ncbi:MAG TPA: hypothetical protein VHV76_07320 [Mycobacteriales bacterium]|nr:hypothetical protein [Mycobacteriales bacterium]
MRSSDRGGHDGRLLMAGLGGLVFLALLIVQNALTLFTDPADSASADQILHFAHAQAWSVDLLVVTYVLGFPALLAFAAGLSRRCVQLAPASEIWGCVGRMSAVVIVVLFGLVNIVQVVIVAARADLASDPALVRTLWILHNAVFTLNLLAIGGALLGLGRGATQAGLVPRWMGPVSTVGAILLAIAAAPAVAEVHGSKILAVGLVGFLCWLVLLATSSISLLQGTATRSPSVARGLAAPDHSLSVR